MPANKQTSGGGNGNSTEASKHTLKRHRVEYEPQGRAAMAEHATLFETLPGGMHAHVSPEPMPGMPRGPRTKLYLRNYPSPYSEKHGGYTTEKGDATDDTTRMKARSVQKAMPKGQAPKWGQMYDYYGDVYDGPHGFKAAEGSKTDFKPSTHFINKLSADEKERFIASKIKVLQKVMVDAIVIDGHEGADADIAGVGPLKYWPEWLEKARALAIEEAASIIGHTPSYDIQQPPEELLAAAGAAVLKEGESAPSVKDHEVQHECGAMKCMSLFHRARVDAATRWVHRHALGDASVNYFKSLTPQFGEYSDQERKMLQDDAKAREGGYEGPWPLEATLTAAQQAARTAAISAGCSQRSRGGKELLEKAADAAAVGHKEAVQRMEEIKEQKSANGKKGAKKKRRNAGAVEAPLAWVKIRLLSGGDAELCAVRRAPTLVKKNSKGDRVIYPGNCKTTLGKFNISFPKYGRKKDEIITISGADVAVMEEDYTPPPPPPA